MDAVGNSTCGDSPLPPGACRLKSERELPEAVTLLRSPSQAWLRIEVTPPVGSVGDLSLRMNCRDRSGWILFTGWSL